MRLSPLFVSAALIAFPGLASAALVPSGSVIDDGVVADITSAGLDSISEVLPSLMGSLLGDALVIDDTYVDLGEVLGCQTGLSLQGVNVEMTIDGAELHTQSPNKVLIDLDVTIAMNNAANPFDVNVSMEGSEWYEVWCFIDESCSVYVDPTPLHATATVQVSVVAGVVSVSLVSMTQDLATSMTSDDLHLPDCELLESILDIAWSFLIDYVTGFIDDTLGSTVEEALAGALPPLSFEGETTLLETTLTYSMEAASLTTGTDTIRVTMDAAFSAPPASCVAPYDPGGSITTGSGALPGPFVTHPETGASYDLGVLIDDDLGNNALYTLWRGGVLCYTADPADLGFPLGTSLLSLLLLSEENREAFMGIWLGEDQPILIRTVPTVPPSLVFSGDHAAEVYVESLDLEFMAFTQDRWARVIAMRVDLTAGVDFEMQADTGALGIVLDLDTAHLNAEVVYNEMVPDLSSDMEVHFGDAMGSLVDVVLGSFISETSESGLPMISFPIPAIYGLGLASIDFAPVGSEDDWGGGFARMSYDPDLAAEGCGGCDEDGGCSTGCDSGCNASATPAQRAQAMALNASLLSFLGMVIAIRRRR